MMANWLLRPESALGLKRSDLQAVFHHQPDGRPAIGIPCHRFHCSANAGHIYAIGEDAVARIQRIASALLESGAVVPWLQAPILHTQDLCISHAPQTLSYTTNDLVVCRDAEQFKRWSKSGEESRLLHVQDVLKRGFERQIEALGMAFQVPSPVVLSVSHERPVPKLTRHVSSKTFARVASVIFTLPVALAGHWVAGGLINRGYGRIVAL